MSIWDAFRTLNSMLTAVGASGHADAVREVQHVFEGVIRENNALRRTNERLRAENKRLSEEVTL